MSENARSGKTTPFSRVPLRPKIPPAGCAAKIGRAQILVCL
jgi:hypothetical protein